MALIPCPECKQQVSDKASSCPHCGNPLGTHAAPASFSVRTAKGEAVTTEATGKNWKIVQLVGALICVIGVVSCTANKDDPLMSMTVVFLGVAVFLFGRFGAWWKHG